MNQRQRNKRKKAAALNAPAKPSLQEAWDVVAEACATTGGITFFVNPDWDTDSTRLALYDMGKFKLISKPVREV